MKEPPSHQDLLWFVIKTRSKIMDLHEYIDDVVTDMDKGISLERAKSLITSAQSYIIDLESDVHKIIRQNLDEFVELIANNK